jgi:hypothetical protein
MRSLLAAVSMVFLGATTTWAVLGRPAASVAADQRRLRGDLRSSAGAGFSVHEISAADGSVVREYVSPAGDVFGVAWQGPTQPNLVELLGDYFPAFQEATRSARHRRGPVAVRTDRLVVETGGHMRAFHGRAYLPDRLPGVVSQTAVR